MGSVNRTNFTRVLFMERMSQPVLAGILTALVGFTSSSAVVLTGLRAVGASPSEDRWAEAGWAAAADLEPPSDLHGTSAYRRHLAGILVRRALEEAYRRAERPS